MKPAMSSAPSRGSTTPSRQSSAAVSSSGSSSIPLRKPSNCNLTQEEFEREQMERRKMLLEWRKKKETTTTRNPPPKPAPVSSRPSLTKPVAPKLATASRIGSRTSTASSSSNRSSSIPVASPVKKVAAASKPMKKPSSTMSSRSTVSSRTMSTTSKAKTTVPKPVVVASPKAIKTSKPAAKPQPQSRSRPQPVVKQQPQPAVNQQAVVNKPAPAPAPTSSSTSTANPIMKKVASLYKPVRPSPLVASFTPQKTTPVKDMNMKRLSVTSITSSDGTMSPLRLASPRLPTATVTNRTPTSVSKRRSISKSSPATPVALAAEPESVQESIASSANVTPSRNTETTRDSFKPFVTPSGVSFVGATLSSPKRSPAPVAIDPSIQPLTPAMLSKVATAFSTPSHANAPTAGIQLTFKNLEERLRSAKKMSNIQTDYEKQLKTPPSLSQLNTRSVQTSPMTPAKVDEATETSGQEVEMMDVDEQVVEEVEQMVEEEQLAEDDEEEEEFEQEQEQEYSPDEEEAVWLSGTEFADIIRKDRRYLGSTFHLALAVPSEQQDEQAGAETETFEITSTLEGCPVVVGDLSDAVAFAEAGNMVAARALFDLLGPSLEVLEDFEANYEGDRTYIYVSSRNSDSWKHYGKPLWRYATYWITRAECEEAYGDNEDEIVSAVLECYEVAERLGATPVAALRDALQAFVDRQMGGQGIVIEGTSNSTPATPQQFEQEQPSSQDPTPSPPKLSFDIARFRLDSSSPVTPPRTSALFNSVVLRDDEDNFDNDDDMMLVSETPSHAAEYLAKTPRDKQVNNTVKTPKSAKSKNEVMIEMVDMLSSMSLVDPKVKSEFDHVKAESSTPGSSASNSAKEGTVTILTPVRAKKSQKEELGVDAIITPVRRSVRHLAADGNECWTSDENADPLKQLLENNGYAFVPNKNLEFHPPRLVGGSGSVKKEHVTAPSSSGMMTPVMKKRMDLMDEVDDDPTPKPRRFGNVL